MKKQTFHTLSFLALTALTVSATALPAFAAEHEGGSSPGGGNSVDGLVIGSYLKPIEQIKGYRTIVAPTIADVRARLPRFLPLLESTIDELVFYEVPASLKPIAASQTGLPFDSQQPALHSMLTGEVFLDHHLFTGLKSDTERGKLLLQEILEHDLLKLCMPGGRVRDWPSGDTCKVVAMKVVRVATEILSESHAFTSEGLRIALLKAGYPECLYINAALISDLTETGSCRELR